MGKKENETVTVKVKCKLGNVSIGDHTASVRCAIPIGSLCPQDAVATFVGARLKAVLAIGDPDQDTLPGVDADPVVDSVADVTQISVSPEHYGFTLGFKKGEIEVSDLSDMAKKDAVLAVERIGNSSDDVKSAEPAEAGAEE